LGDGRGIVEDHQHPAPIRRMRDEDDKWTTDKLLMVAAATLTVSFLIINWIAGMNGGQRVIPNGELTQFTNFTRGWARAVVDVSVGYETDVRRALETLERVGREWALETGLAMEPPEAQGVVRFGEGDLGLRLIAKIEPARRFDVEIDLRRRIKEAFQRDGIPFPQRVVYVQERAIR
jgi:small conductance mechanosensitive channel